MSDNSLSRNDIDQSLTDSDLTYLAKNSSSLVIERTSKRSYADNPEYGTGNTNLVVNFQTGVDYVDGRNSYLRMVVEPNKLTNDKISWGYGTVLNLIDTVTIKSRSGTVLGRTERVNLLQYYETKYKNSYSYFGSTVGGVQAEGGGMASGLLGYSDGLTGDTLGPSREYNIPLHLIHSFFDQENLLPSMVMKGMRLEITLADASTAFKVTDGTPIAPTYVVRNVWASLDSYRLTDDAMRKLNDMSREAEGLVLQYHDYEQSRFTRPVGVNNVSTEVRKTVSMANEAFLVTRIETNINDKAKDSFLAQPLTDGDRYQWRVGSMYLPQTELQGQAAWYANACYCKGQLKSREQPFVKYEHTLAPTIPTFTSTASAGGGYAISCVDLDRYWLDLSGLAINNSVTLNANMEYSDASAAGELDLFLKHTRRIAVYNDNIIVMD